jgi:hypothetical protein
VVITGTNNLWHIPPVPIVRNTNTDTVIVKQPPTEFLASCPLPSKAVFNVYELKSQSKLVCYLHAALGFPTKPTWLKAIKNWQYALWPGLTANAMAKHFPELEETIKVHVAKPEAASAPQSPNTQK